MKTNISNFSFKNHSSVSSDANWLCVFCNLPANVPGLAGEATGDLFGPYFISIPDQINSDESRKHSWNKANSEQVKKKVSPENLKFIVIMELLINAAFRSFEKKNVLLLPKIFVLKQLLKVSYWWNDENFFLSCDCESKVHFIT